MKNFRVGQQVKVPNGRVGTLKSIDGNRAIVWFDEAGNDTGLFNLTTLTYV